MISVIAVINVNCVEISGNVLMVMRTDNEGDMKQIGESQELSLTLRHPTWI